jgi:AAA ATPase-like protein
MNDIPPMPGREGEFALIRELLAAAGRGEGSFLVVQGRARLGKTTLLQSALEQAAAQGLRGRCIIPGPGTSAMNPVTTVMTTKNLQNTSSSGNKATTATMDHPVPLEDPGSATSARPGG